MMQSKRFLPAIARRSVVGRGVRLATEADMMRAIGTPIRLFAALMVFWLMLLGGSLAIESIAVGVVISALIAYFLSSNLSYFYGYRFTPASLAATFGFIVYFLIELVKANLSVAKIVLTPSLPLDPVIVRIRTNLKNPVARVFLANSITLTPGTMTVEMKGEWLYIHCVVAPSTDTEQATKAIAAGFEGYLEVMYG
jgi:multicomponent Na+:H+ antiporter subunit E